LPRRARASCRSPLLIRTCGPADAPRCFQRWRMFYTAVAERFGFRSGEEWGVAHYLFTRR
jgi:cyclopropane-fatty-acyl-phospholipid synthase